MTEHTELELDSAIAADAEAISKMMQKSPAELAKNVEGDPEPIVQSICRLVLSGMAISHKQKYVLAEAAASDIWR